jgi:hypothetical protein
MTQIYDQAVPIVNLPFLYITGAKISNDATTPNSLIDISAGQMRDQTNTYDMNLGNYNGQTNSSAAANVSTTVNSAVKGFNGIDTGTIAASTVYFVYVISDPVSGQTSGAVISLGVPSVGPLMPFGYSAYRHIGYAITDASSHFLLAYTSGGENARLLTFDAPQATAITAGAATSYTAIDLTKWVPTLSINTPVQISYSYLPNAAGDTFKMQPVNATGDAVTITGQVSAVHVTGIATVFAQIVSAGTKPEINYKVSSASDAVAINVAGFNFYI